MAHEMAHVTRRHVAQLYRRSRNTGLAAAVAGVLAAVLPGDPAAARAGSAAADLAATAYLGTFTREAEREADRVAIATLVQARIDPRAMVEFFEILAREQSGRARPPPFLSSHPTTPERIAAARAEIPRHGVLPPVSRGDVRRFRNLRERLPTRETRVPAPQAGAHRPSYGPSARIGPRALHRTARARAPILN